MEWVLVGVTAVMLGFWLGFSLGFWIGTPRKDAS